MTSTINPIEETRERIHLSRPQMDSLVANYLSENPSARELQRFLSRLVREYARYRSRILARVHELARANGGYLTTAEVAEVFDMGEFQVSNLRRRFKLRAVTSGSGPKRRTVYPVHEIELFVDRPPGYREHHNPLSWSFLRDFERRNPPGRRLYPDDPDDASDASDEVAEEREPAAAAS